MKKAIKQYALDLLKKHGCDVYTYGDVPAEDVLSDLKKEYPDGLDYSLIDVANAIKTISKLTLIHRAPYRVVWDTEHGCDAVDADSFADARNTLVDIYYEWQHEQFMSWKNCSAPDSDELEDWDRMLYDCGCTVQKYNSDTDDYDDYWYPNDKELEKIGWVDSEKLLAQLKNVDCMLKEV